MRTVLLRTPRPQAPAARHVPRRLPRRRVPLRDARPRRHAARQLRPPLHRGDRRHRRRRPQRRELGTDPGEHSAERGVDRHDAASQGARRRRRRRRRSPRSRATDSSSGKRRQAIGGNGPPTLAGNWIDDPRAQPVPARRRPRAARRRRGRDQPGRREQRRPARRRHDHASRRRSRSACTIVGIATFGSADGLRAAHVHRLHAATARRSTCLAPHRTRSSERSR